MYIAALTKTFKLISLEKVALRHKMQYQINLRNMYQAEIFTSGTKILNSNTLDDDI